MSYQYVLILSRGVTYAALHNTWSDVSQVAALFIVTHPFLQLTKTSERVNAAGDRCVAITLMQYFIAIEH